MNIKENIKNIETLEKTEVLDILNNVLSTDVSSNIEIEAIDNILSELKDVNLPLIEVSNFESSLIERKEELQNIEKTNFEDHIIHFIFLLDYISTHKDKLPHKMFFNFKSNGDAATFEGFFEDILWKFQISANELNLFSFYANDKNAKPLTFSNFETDLKLVENYYVGDMNTNDFKEIIKKYKVIKENKKD